MQQGHWPSCPSSPMQSVDPLQPLFLQEPLVGSFNFLSTKISPTACTELGSRARAGGWLRLEEVPPVKSELFLAIHELKVSDSNRAAFVRGTGHRQLFPAHRILPGWTQHLLPVLGCQAVQLGQEGGPGQPTAPIQTAAAGARVVAAGLGGLWQCQGGHRELSLSVMAQPRLQSWQAGRGSSYL